MQQITGKTVSLGLIGSPVGHSGSPAMHNYAAELLGLDYAYLAYDVKEAGVPAALDAMRALGIRGFNVTMPCKKAAARYVDELSPAAALIGACNTIVNEGGVLKGYNTDGDGFTGSLRERGLDIRGQRVVVAGAGGAGISLLVRCALEGARSVTVLKRRNASWQEAVEKAGQVSAACPACEIRVCDMNDEARTAAEIAACDILANATSVGMRPNEKASILSTPALTAALRPDMVVFDAVYDPTDTLLLQQARAAGCTAIGGRRMLLWQGVSAFRLFTGHEMPVEKVRERFFS